MSLHINSENFGQIAYQKIGSGSTLILIHGFPADSNLWHKLVPALSVSYNLILPDLPGAGETDLYKNNITMEDMAEAINEILDAEKISQAIVAGHSMGGYVALAFAAFYPEKIKGLALVHSSAYADNAQKKEYRHKAIELMKKKSGKENFLKQMIPALFSKDTNTNNPKLIKEVFEMAIHLPAESMISFYNSMMQRPDHTKTLIEAHFPVQWIIGKEDSAIPPEAALEQSKLSNISFISMYKNCAHMSMLEQPEMLIQDLRAFSSYCNNR